MATKLKNYPEYKASGIDWLGDIPSHWMVAPIKTLLAKSSSGVWGEEAKEDGNDVVCFRVADFDYPHLCLKYNNVTYRSIAPAQMQGREVEYGDIVIEKSGGGDLNPVGRAVISTFEGLATCSNFMHVISANGRAINSFLNYLLATIYCKGLNRLYFAQTTGIQNLNIKEYLAQRIALPSLDEQTKISAYLDDVTGKIDALISEKRKQMEDIRAYRTSLITETVTRGLNPDAPLRPSGIDWLGDIPNHWKIVKLGWLANVQTGTTPSTSIEEYWNEPTKNWFTPGDFVQFEIKDSKRKVSEFAFNENACRVFPPYTVYMVGIGATLGKVAYCKESASANQQINAILFNSEIYPVFGAYYLLSIADIIKSKANFATLPILNQEQTKQLLLEVPPLAEQQSIANFLDAKTAKIDELISELTKQIDELTEYKQAVITEAVTGKVDVRDYKPSN